MLLLIISTLILTYLYPFTIMIRTTSCDILIPSIIAILIAWMIYFCLDVILNIPAMTASIVEKLATSKEYYRLSKDNRKRWAFFTKMINKKNIQHHKH